MKGAGTQSVLAYIFMPVLFAAIGYGLLTVALRPVWELASAAANLLVAADTPVFSPELDDIFDPNASQDSYAPIYTDEATGEQYIMVEDITMPPSGTLYANLVCDRIELSCPVYWDDTPAILRAGAGQSLSSFLPGFGRVIVISAHNSTYFRPLQNVESGDVITYNTNYCRYQYEVTDVRVMDEYDLAKLLTKYFPDEQERLILYTCYPFTSHVGRRTDRLVVTAKRTEGCTVRWRSNHYE